METIITIIAKGEVLALRCSKELSDLLSNEYGNNFEEFIDNEDIYDENGNEVWIENRNDEVLRYTISNEIPKNVTKIIKVTL
jgi:hypothetical protein